MEGRKDGWKEGKMDGRKEGNNISELRMQHQQATGLRLAVRAASRYNGE